jgi:Xaa-Pro aminopeptidase
VAGGAQGPEAATEASGDVDPAVDAPDPFRRPSTGVLEARRKRFLDSLGTGVALIRSSSPRDLESAYPQASDFRQDNDFLYFTGLETPDSWLLMAARPGGGAAQVLFIPERDTSRERWTGKKPGPREASRVSGIGSVRHTSEFEKLVRSGQISSLGGGGPLHLPLSEDALCSELMRALTGASPEVRDVDPVVARVRLVKDEFELQQLRRAVELTDRAQRAAMAAAEPGIWEYELEAVIEYEFRRGGAERVGFPSIVGSGPNSVVLHYDKNRRKTRKGDLVVMDVGAEYSYYTADVTRTIPVSGRFTERQRELYELVLGAQEAGIEAVRPGATMSDVARAARTYMRRNSGDLCGRKTCDEHFTHGVGHWLGMDVHDVGSYSTPFRPGMVLTVEPGVYLPEEDLGIRIEDDVLVTEDGREVLSKAPKTVEDVEAAMAGEPAGRPAPATGSREGARVGG